ncbi:hypothetical protein [Micromonospora sp. NPDC007230]|uniref:hypothetical protein n=1 Tax=Micromonospora sp. NPDC007230 TaxID=3364237 RepID=UPI003686C585
MTTTEQQLRDLFAADAARAPRASGLADGALRKVRHRRRVRTAWVSGVAVSAVSLVVAGGMAVPRSDSPSIGAPSVVPTFGRAGEPVPGEEAAISCVVEYSLPEVAKRAFSFDGTVIAIGPARERPGSVPFGVGVTLRVHQWFRGGTSDTVTVNMPAPQFAATDDGLHNNFGSPTYGVGTRLLVSGEPRWGGEPLDYPIAWWGCGGFTRYYSPQVAAAWERATR